MATRWARFARGWLAASFATLIAAASHAAAGGIAPNLVSVALALAFSGVACIALTGRSLSLVRTSLAVGGSQLAFHLLFSSLGGATGAAGVAGGAHDHAASSLALISTTPAHHTDGWMWLAHLAAAVLTVVVLRRGEAAFWGMRDSALRFLRTVIESAPRLPVAVRAPSLSPVPARTVAPRHLVHLLGSLQHRGPPATALA